MDTKEVEKNIERIRSEGTASPRRKQTYKRNSAGDLTEIKHDAGPWPCDPLKNRDCTKVNCYLRGGECRLTYKQDCRREETE